MQAAATRNAIREQSQWSVSYYAKVIAVVRTQLIKRFSNLCDVCDVCD